jgi:transposase
MVKKRNNYSPRENVAILKRHLVEKVPVSDLCDQYGIHPTVFYRCKRSSLKRALMPCRDPGTFVQPGWKDR